MAVVKLNRAIQYRAYPTEAQAVLLAKTFGCVRFAWNRMLMDAQQFLNEAGTFFVPTPAKYKKEALRHFSGGLQGRLQHFSEIHRYFLQSSITDGCFFVFTRKSCRFVRIADNENQGQS